MQLDFLSLLVGALGAAALPWLNAWPNSWQASQERYAEKLKDEFSLLRSRLEELHTLLLEADERHRVDLVGVIENQATFLPDRPKLADTPSLNFERISGIVKFYAPELSELLHACLYTHKRYIGVRFGATNGGPEKLDELVEVGDLLTKALMSLQIGAVELNSKKTAAYLELPQRHPVQALIARVRRNWTSWTSPT